MTIKRVQRAADLRGLFFDGCKRWINSGIGYGYTILTPRGYFSADRLEAVYRHVMEYPRVER